MPVRRLEEAVAVHVRVVPVMGRFLFGLNAGLLAGALLSRVATASSAVVVILACGLILGGLALAGEEL